MKLSIRKLLLASSAIFGPQRGWLPTRLFSNSEEGIWLDPSDLSTLFQDTVGTTPVTTTGQTLARVNDKSGNGLNTTQAIVAARPSYIADSDGKFIQHDLVDDALTVTLPDLGTEATVAYVTRSEVHLLEDQTISGSYTLPTQEIAGMVIIDRALTIAEKVHLIRYLAAKVEGVNYGAEIDRLTLIAINAVDVFVYDTSKDSDGGAWRTGALAQASSWYNETLNTATRGSRREFPAVAVIVAESNKVTIYDGDDPSLPMWMVFEGVFNSAATSVPKTSVSALNGIISFGTNQGTDTTGSVVIVKILSEEVFSRRPIGSTQRGKFLGTIAQRNTTAGWDISTNQSIVGQPINDVAMTVLPDAPIDAATGLPVPTIACATAGGVSVIKDDGTVVDLPTSGTATNWVSFNDRHQLVSRGNFGDRWVLREIPDADVANLETADATFIAKPYRQYGQSADYQRQVNFSDTYASDLGNLKNGLLLEYGAGSALGSTSLVALTTSTYNTGWMNGDIKGAFLSDTDDTDLVGGVNQITNGTFDTDANWLKGTGWTIGSGVASCDGTQTGNTALTQQGTVSGANLNFEAGKAYVLTFDVTISAGFITQVEIGGTYDTTDITSSGTYTKVITAGGTNDRLGFTVNIDFVGTIDNVTVTDGDADRSVNSNGLIVNGTVTRSPVATGADLVAYSGFSSSNYLEQPYNSDLDFGTGDFCIMGWVKASDASADYIAASYPNDGSSGGFLLAKLTNNTITFSTRESGVGSGVTTASSVSGGVWAHVCAVRSNSGTTQVIYINGEASVSESVTARNITNSGNLLVGVRGDALTSAWRGSLALWRISATAPTAEQIAKIYEDEKVLFQENAQATLYGSSDAVTALAHDPDTDLLHVGTSAGRSVFEGLRRVGNTTTSVSTAISASGGLIVEK